MYGSTLTNKTSWVTALKEVPYNVHALVTITKITKQTRWPPVTEIKSLSQ